MPALLNNIIVYLVALNSLKLRQRPFNLSHRAYFQNKIGHLYAPEPPLVYSMEGSILRLRGGRVGRSLH